MTVVVPLRQDDGREVGTLAVSQLPRRQHLLGREGDVVQLEEDGIYRFVIDGPVGELELAPAEELFSFDDSSHRQGRLSPRQYVGRICVQAQFSHAAASCLLRVRPRKLDEETEYRRMLDDISEIAASAVLQGFAPASAALAPDIEERPDLLYQQFAFLHSRLVGQGQDDLALVLNRPHTAWVDIEEHRPPGGSLRGGTRTLRALARPGPRVPSSGARAIESVPQRLATLRTEETLDTDPNRFVVFALERWRALAQGLRARLETQSAQPGPVARGLDATNEVLAIIDRTLSSPMFKEVGRLASFPSGNQVLQKRAGYREILRTFALTELGARLALDWDIDDAFAASQRNIATLYEYWTFLQLTRSVGRVCGEDRTSDAFELASDDLSLGFARGRKSRLSWEVLANGRRLAVELYFNREFLVSSQPDASWTRAMRPDCSLKIRPVDVLGDVRGDDLAMWVHFDAKYRVEFLDQQFSPPPADDAQQAAEAEATERLARSKREDLLKMHAYRDAIRRSAGAYVLYPGNEPQAPFLEHHEILPGLGAFVLRPGDAGARGAEELERFLTQLLDHAADRATQHERSRYWRTVIHRSPPAVRGEALQLPALDRPPSDATVLCGYVRSAAHRAWIERLGLYNLRAGDRSGAVDLGSDALSAVDVLLHGGGGPPLLFRRAGNWVVHSDGELMALGYPDPGGKNYLCCSLELRPDPPLWFADLRFDAPPFRAEIPGAPVVLTWDDLLDAAF